MQGSRRVRVGSGRTCVEAVVSGEMRADEHDLTAFHDDIGFLEVGAAGPDRLHLPTFERQPGLEAFLDKIVVERLAVLDDAHGPFYTTRYHAAGDATRDQVRAGRALGRGDVRAGRRRRGLPAVPAVCGGAKVLERHENGKTARIDIDYHGVKAHFTTANENQPPDRS